MTAISSGDGLVGRVRCRKGSDREVSVRVRRRFSFAGPSRLAWLAGLGVAVALSQTDASSSSSSSSSAAADDAVISIPVTVTDSGGRPVRGLVQDDFLVIEDGKPQ